MCAGDSDRIRSGFVGEECRDCDFGIGAIRTVLVARRSMGKVLEEAIMAQVKYWASTCSS